MFFKVFLHTSLVFLTGGLWAVVLFVKHVVK